MFYENNFKKIKFLIFLVKKQSLYLCKFTNLFPILKNSLGSTFFELYPSFFLCSFRRPYIRFW
jgi:hypothetical protein